MGDERPREGESQMRLSHLFVTSLLQINASHGQESKRFSDAFAKIFSHACDRRHTADI
jgi:hypothetical protein